MNEQPLVEAGQARRFSLAAETQFAPNGIVSRTLLSAGGGRVVLFGFDAGQELTEHTSTQTALVQVLSGVCEFALAGQWQTLKAGDVIAMPPGLAHAVRATERCSLLLTLFKPA